MERANITKKEYENSNFIKINNIQLFQRVFIPQMQMIRKRLKDSFFDRISKLTQNNKQFFLTNYGKQDFVFVYEYWNYAWSFKFPNGILLVFTGNKGTSYEFLGTPDQTDQTELVKLFNAILKFD